MRKWWGLLSAMLLTAATVVAAPNPPRGAPAEQPFPHTLRNARYVSVAAYDGAQFDPDLLSEDRDAGVLLELQRQDRRRCFGGAAQAFACGPRRRMFPGRGRGRG